MAAGERSHLGGRIVGWLVHEGLRRSSCARSSSDWKLSSSVHIMGTLWKIREWYPATGTPLAPCPKGLQRISSYFEISKTGTLPANRRTKFFWYADHSPPRRMNLALALSSSRRMVWVMARAVLLAGAGRDGLFSRLMVYFVCLKSSGRQMTLGLVELVGVGRELVEAGRGLGEEGVGLGAGEGVVGGPV